MIDQTHNFPYFKTKKLCVMVQWRQDEIHFVMLLRWSSRLIIIVLLSVSNVGPWFDFLITHSWEEFYRCAYRYCRSLKCASLYNEDNSMLCSLRILHLDTCCCHYFIHLPTTQWCPSFRAGRSVMLIYLLFCPQETFFFQRVKTRGCKYF